MLEIEHKKVRKSNQKENEKKKLIYNVNETHQFQTCANINFMEWAYSRVMSQFGVLTYYVLQPSDFPYNHFFVEVLKLLNRRIMEILNLDDFFKYFHSI